MPDTLTSFLHMNCTSAPHRGTLCTFYRWGNSVTCSNSHRNSGSSNSTTDDHCYNMLLLELDVIPVTSFPPPLLLPLMP